MSFERAVASIIDFVGYKVADVAFARFIVKACLEITSIPKLRDEFVAKKLLRLPLSASSTSVTNKTQFPLSKTHTR